MNIDIPHIVQGMEAIRKLPRDVSALKGNSLGDSEVIAITSFGFLKELDLSGCEGITDRSVSELIRLTSLEKLDLSFCNQITDSSIKALASLPVLGSLNLNWCYSVTDLGLGSLAECKSLESVSLWGCERITDVGVEALASLPKLKILELPEFARITDQTLLVLSAKARSLERLRLDHLEEISNKGLVHLSGLRSLRNLTILSCPGVTAEAVAVLQRDLPQCQICFERSGT